MVGEYYMLDPHKIAYSGMIVDKDDRFIGFLNSPKYEKEIDWTDKNNPVYNTEENIRRRQNCKKELKNKIKEYCKQNKVFFSGSIIQR